ncbi:response regulator transcription factor [uncultured Acetatifactor sp.]|uniref:response regulator transcription factor n=1 Tax=uncultured Acetatifactor sp. TaxID=1671927 RepID=UPI002625D406|nr:response regulator transcription factor [uncultured Acetatifactor sp.]MCI9651344.1 response regulator transcription factor [Lachnospiraceae bacterium]
MEIMLVEDNEAIIMGLEYLLSQEGYQVVTARNMAQAEDFLARLDVGLVLLDIGLPDGDGFQLCRKVKREGQTPVIFLTAKEDETDVVKGLDMGADDYVVKPFRNRELVSRIRSVLRRSGKGTSVLRCGDIALNTETGKVTRGGSEIALTKLEYKILSNMMSCPGKLFTRDEILSDIWDISGNFVNDNTLSVTVKRLREKLGDSDGRLIKTVRGMGYRLER